MDFLVEYYDRLYEGVYTPDYRKVEKIIIRNKESEEAARSEAKRQIPHGIEIVSIRFFQD